MNSLYKVADMYKNGYYVEKDEDVAFRIYTYCYENLSDYDERLFGADVCLRIGNAYFYGTGTKKDLQLALKYYQEAEQLFYVKLRDGDFFSRKGLESVIEKQGEIRELLAKEMPSFDWTGE